MFKSQEFNPPSLRMMEQLDINLRKLVKDYEGPKLVIVAVGGGLSLARIGTIPGCSRILEAIYLPYSDASINSFLGYTNTEKAVSANRAANLYSAAKSKHISSRVISITAALTSSRHRKGMNHAWIDVEGTLYHKILYKETEQEWNNWNSCNILPYQRYIQDIEISEFCLNLL